MKNFFKNKYYFSISIILNVVLVTILFLNVNTNDNLLVNIKRENVAGYKFISPILDCENFNPNTSTNLNYKETNDFIESLVKKHNLNTASVYYRDLNNGPWYGYNEKEYFTPASLIKIPIMISLLKYAETEPSILEKKITVTENDFENALSQTIQSKNQLKSGHSYTVLQLMERMIKESDNVATNILNSSYPQDKYINEAFEHTGVDAKDKNKDILLRVKDYAGFFRVLFNASYLSPEMSELALKELSETSFKDGLVTGVPENIVVAHKFGERSKEQIGLVDDSTYNNGTKQLHDCGIIYYPDKPYILCVMTRGNSIPLQISFIKEVSSYFYKITDK